MRRSLKLSPVMELLIRLLVVTALAVVALYFIRKLRPLENSTNERLPKSVPHEGSHE